MSGAIARPKKDEEHQAHWQPDQGKVVLRVLLCFTTSTFNFMRELAGLVQNVFLDIVRQMCLPHS